MQGAKASKAGVSKWSAINKKALIAHKLIL